MSGDYSSLLVYASLVGAAAVSRKTVWLKMKITHNVKNALFDLKKYTKRSSARYESGHTSVD